MPEAIPIVEYSMFSGINNVDDPTKLFPVRTDDGEIYPLTVAVNVDIDNTRRLKIRPGSKKVITGTMIHSLWNTPDESRAFFVEGDKLYLVNDDYSVTQMVSGLSEGFRMSYEEVNGNVYFTNNQIIGYIDSGNVYHALTDPATNYKVTLPPGRFICYYNGRLYVANGSILWVSDPMALTRLDMRRGFIAFHGAITLLRAVDNGLYLADGEIHFLKGDSLKELKIDGNVNCATIPYTDVVVDGQYVGNGEKTGKHVFFMSEKGICVGDPDGVIENVTEKRYRLGEHSHGAGVIVNENDMTRYIVTLVNYGSPKGALDLALPTLTMTSSYSEHRGTLELDLLPLETGG